MPSSRLADHPPRLAAASFSAHTADMSPLTIVRAMPFFAPATQFGGVISQARETSRKLAARGHRVRVVTTDNGQPDHTPRDTWIEQDGYEVYYARTTALHRGVPYWTPSIREPLLQALPEADVLQLNVGLTLTNALARKLARPLRGPGPSARNANLL